MCAACLEFIKDKLTVKELASALKEASSNDPNHLDVVRTLIDKSADNPTKLKENLKSLVD